MLSTCPHFRFTIAKYLGPLFLFLFLIGTFHRTVAAGSPDFRQEPDDGGGGGGGRGGAPTHLNFFRSALRGRQRVLSCANDPNVCLDRQKNPWGGTTCCFQKFCRDTLRDSNNCGECGRACAYGFVCCDGRCVDVRNDPLHCGSCFEECPNQGRCSYAMCDYGG